MCSTNATSSTGDKDDTMKNNSTTADGAAPTKKTTETLAQRNLRVGTMYGCLSMGILMMAFSVTFPQMQSRRDELQCDSLCWGSMTSTRSTLSLLGSALMGRLSDSDDGWFLARSLGGGRRATLYIGTVAQVLGFSIAASFRTLRGMWASFIPGSLFQQNFSVMKALFSDYHTALEQESQVGGDGAVGVGSTTTTTTTTTAPTERAGTVGKLGMAVGLAFMVGTLSSATLISSYDRSLHVAMGLTLLSAIFVTTLPRPTAKQATAVADSNKSLTAFWNVKAARSPPVLFLMVIRLCMGLAFHVFSTIWQVSLRERFQFGTADHGKLMGFIGLMYALSQGIVARLLVQAAGSRYRVLLLLACCFLLGGGRLILFATSSLGVVYFMYSAIVVALGVVNTVVTADTSRVAPPQEVGAVFGLLEATENAAGIVGPLVAGGLAQRGMQAPLYTAVGLYAVVFGLILAYYRRFLLAGQDGGVATADSTTKTTTTTTTTATDKADTVNAKTTVTAEEEKKQA